MNVFLIGMLSVALIYLLPFIIGFLLCALLGFASKGADVVARRLGQRKKLPVNPRAEAGKLILNRIKKPENYTLH